MGPTFKIIEDGRNIAYLKGTGLEQIDNHMFKMPVSVCLTDHKWMEISQYNLAITSDTLEGYVLFLLTNVMD